MPGKMPPIGDSIASGNRVSAMEAAEAKAMRRRPSMPSPAESVASGNRMSAANAADARAVRKYGVNGTGYGSFKNK
jgi:hypothetical protein